MTRRVFCGKSTEVRDDRQSCPPSEGGVAGGDQSNGTRKSRRRGAPYGKSLRAGICNPFFQRGGHAAFSRHFDIRFKVGDLVVAIEKLLEMFGSGLELDAGKAAFRTSRPFKRGRRCLSSALVSVADPSSGLGMRLPRSGAVVAMQTMPLLCSLTG